MANTLPHRSVTANTPPPTLSPETQLALRAATRTLHRLAWDIGQVAIDLNDCETLAANVIVSYHSALDLADGNRRGK